MSLKTTPTEVAEDSHSMLEAEVIDIRRSRLNTSDGNFPSADQLRSKGVYDLVVLTDIEVEVITWHAGGLEQPRKGTMTITVPGGAVQTNLSAGQAAALGVLKVVETSRGDVEVEKPVEGPVDNYVWGHSPSVRLSEGDQVTLLLTNNTIVGYDSGVLDEQLLTITDRSGVFRKGTGGWVEDLPGGDLVSLAAIAGAVGSDG